MSYIVHVDCCGLSTIVIKKIIIIIIIIVVVSINQSSCLYYGSVIYRKERDAEAPCSVIDCYFQPNKHSPQYIAGEYGTDAAASAYTLNFTGRVS